MFGEKWRKSPLVATEFTTRRHSQMRASICFASIIVVLFKKIKEKTHFEYVKGKHSFQSEVKVRRHNFQP